MKLKHYSYKSSEHSARPNLLFEVRIDLQDVRSGYRGSDSFLLKTEWDSRDDGVPTPDMVERIDEGSISTLEPPSEVNVPAGVEEKVISHILKYSRQTVWRNPALGIYSSPRESRQEFIQKCREEFLGQRSEKVRNLRELYTHRFGELEKKALESVEQGEMMEFS